MYVVEERREQRWCQSSKGSASWAGGPNGIATDMYDYLHPSNHTGQAFLIQILQLPEFMWYSQGLAPNK